MNQFGSHSPGKNGGSQDKDINMTNQPVTYKFTSTKEYHDAFPCAYRQWRADSHCNNIHGYSFSMKFYFGTNDLDVRNWAADYGGLKELKRFLEDQFDHTLLVAEDDPGINGFRTMDGLGVIQLRLLPAVGAEKFAEYIFNKVNPFVVEETGGRVKVTKVEFFENDRNSAIYIP